jgi:broad specificity phosphatase PhoE
MMPRCLAPFYLYAVDGVSGEELDRYGQLFDTYRRGPRWYWPFNESDRSFRERVRSAIVELQEQFR